MDADNPPKGKSQKQCRTKKSRRKGEKKERVQKEIEIRMNAAAKYQQHLSDHLINAGLASWNAMEDAAPSADQQISDELHSWSHAPAESFNPLQCRHLRLKGHLPRQHQPQQRRCPCLHRASRLQKPQSHPFRHQVCSHQLPLGLQSHS